MKSAIIGHTGFVGSNLDRQFEFDDKYNSKNIESIKNKNYDLVVCSGIPASMWYANNFPERDFENIILLLDILKTVKIDKLVLISSTAVFQQSAKNLNEDYQEFEINLTYGKNRRYAEEFVIKNFDQTLIIRLPALFGENLQKNFIYDLLNQEPAFIQKLKFEELLSVLDSDERKLLKSYYFFDKDKTIYVFNKKSAINNKDRENILKTLKKTNFTALNFTHPESSFQFYSLDYLWKDINIALENNLSCLHLCSEPIKARDIAKIMFNIDFKNDNCDKPFDYDMRSKYVKYWNKKGGYQYSRDEILKQIRKYIG